MTSSRDSFDLPVSNASAATAAGYDAYVREFLSYGSSLRALFSIADAAPDCALVQAHAAALHLAFEGGEGWRHATPYLARMREAASGGQAITAREALFCAAVDHWTRCDFAAALASFDELTVRWPADLCALKWGQYHAFNLGDHASMQRFGDRALIAHEGRPYAHGMVAFALEQNHRFEEAEDEGLRAVEVAIDDAWAHHAVAHVMEAQGRAQDGVRWLDRCAHTWARKGVFIRDHNWWHAALFRLGLGRYDEALSVYDARLWGNWPEFPQEQIGAVSMLWRLELRGLDVGDRWTPVVEQVRRRAGEHLLPFHDLHYLFALARAGAPGEAETFLASIRAHAESLSGCAGETWRLTVAPVAEGLLALSRGAYDIAASRLAGAMPTLHRIGGSHAQRHLFSEALDHAIANMQNGSRRAG